MCEAGAQGGNETQKERWGVGTGDYDRSAGWRIRAAWRKRGGLHSSNEDWGEKGEGITSIKGRRRGPSILTSL